MVRFNIKTLIKEWERRIFEFFITGKNIFFIPALLVLLFGTIFIPSYRIAYVEGDNSIFSQARKSDFEDYYVASQNISRGGDPYKIENIKSVQKKFEWKDVGDPEKIRDFINMVKGVGTYLYPPLTAFLLIPVAELSYPAATIIFQTLSILAFLFFALILYSYTDKKQQILHYFLPVLLSSFILYNFLNGNFLHGNILSFLLLLVGAGIYLSFREGIFLNIAGGVLIGIAVVVKITPVFFGLVLLGKKRFSAIAGMGIGVMAGILIPALYTGFDENMHLLQSWYELILGNYSRQGIVRPWANNQSFSAMLGKLFLPGSDSAQASYGLPLFYDASSQISASKAMFYANLARFANVIFLVSGIALSFFLMVKNLKKAGGFNLEAIRLIYLSAILSLLTAGVSWFHAFGILFFPVFLRLNRHFQGEKLLTGEKIGFYLISVFGLFQLLMGGAMIEALALYSVFTMFCVGIAIHTAYLLLSGENDGI